MTDDRSIRHLGGIARAGIREARRTTARYEPGMVVSGKVRAYHEGLESGKGRPVVLIRPEVTLHDEPGWKVMGLTTKSTFEDGTPRIPVAHWEECLNAPGWLWGRRLPILPDGDLATIFGWVHPADARTIDRYLHGDTGPFLPSIAAHWLPILESRRT